MAFYIFGSGAPGVTDSINMSLPNPNGTTQFNGQTLNINLTVNSSTDFDCYLYLNDTLNQSGSYSSGTNVLVDFDLNFSLETEESYVYYVFCDEGTTNETSVNGTFHVDTKNPLLSFTFPLESNSSVINLDYNNLSYINITMTDTNLYSYYLNISYSNGTIISSYNDTALTGNITYTTNISEFINSTGEYLVSIKVCDGHTASVISMAAPTIEDKELNFEGIKIYDTDKLQTNDISYTKLTDRYSYTFNNKLVATSKSFVVEGKENIDVLHGKTEYAGHLVVDGAYWIDFVTLDVKEVNVQRVSRTKVIVTITKNLPTTKWEFNSIGELNCINQISSFFAYNQSNTYYSQVVAGSTTPFNLNITYDSSYITIINATLVYNGTVYNPTKTISGDSALFGHVLTLPNITTNTNFSFYWNYTVNTEVFQTATASQEVLIPGIDDCTTYSAQWLNFSYRDELTDANLTADIEVLFNFVSGTYNSFFGGTFSTASNHTFCIYPANANLTASIDVQYKSATYAEREYIDESTIADNNTDNIILYLLASQNASAITLHIVDDEDNDLENVLIITERWDLGNDTYHIVETEYTDSDGNAQFELKVGTEYYRFFFYRDGVLELTTQKFKIFSTTLEYTLTPGYSNKLAERLLINQFLLNSITYNNLTKLVKYEWDNNVNDLVQSICMNITDFNQTYYSGCSSNSTGSLSFTITQFNISYMAITYARTQQGFLYILDTLGINTKSDWRIFGKDKGMFIAIFLYLFISMIGLGVGVTYDGTKMINITFIMSAVAITAIFFLGVTALSLGGWIGLLAVHAVGIFLVNKREET